MSAPRAVRGLRGKTPGSPRQIGLRSILLILHLDLSSQSSLSDAALNTCLVTGLEINPILNHNIRCTLDARTQSSEGRGEREKTRGLPAPAHPLHPPSSGAPLPAAHTPLRHGPAVHRSRELQLATPVLPIAAHCVCIRKRRRGDVRCRMRPVPLAPPCAACSGEEQSTSSASRT